MGAPVSKLESVEEKTAESLLKSFKHIEAAERRKHATVFNYWLAIRRDRELPAIRDLDPLEISDVAPSSVLLELADGGEDAEIRHAGEAINGGMKLAKISEAPNPSVLSCIAGKLGIIAISREALAFEDHFLGSDGVSRCCVTLLPFSTTGEAVDFVYGLVSLETGVTFAEEQAEGVPEGSEQVEATDEVEPAAEPVVDETPVEEEPKVAEETQAVEEPQHVEDPVAVEPEPITDEATGEASTEPTTMPDDIELPQFLTEPRETGPEPKPGFSKIFDALAGAKGFFGTVAPSEPELPPAEEATQPEAAAEESAPAAEEIEEVAPVAEEPAPIAEEFEEAATVEEPAPVESEIGEEPLATVEEPAPTDFEHVQEPRSMEGTLQSKLTEVRSKADEARAARLRSEALLVEGLSAAYDFALDAEEAPEEYLKLVEEQGLKIQLRSPMKPVVRLAFDGYCDDSTIKDLEAVLSWALKSDLPKGSLAERIESEGGISAVLNGSKRRSSDD